MLLPAFFINNPITRAERIYQQRSNKPTRRWLWLLIRVLQGSAIALALIVFAFMLMTTLMQFDPLTLVEKLLPVFALLCIVVFCYHVYLMFQTMSLAANSISREKQGQTWDLLLLTGMDARRIVWGKWWAIIQLQLPRYVRLTLMHVGITAGLGMVIGLYIYPPNSYEHIMLPPVSTMIVTLVISLAFTLVNLGLGTACGVMASAVSRNSAMTIVRGFGNQLLLSGITASIAIYLIHRILFYYPIWAIKYVFSTDFLNAGISLFDNGLTLVSSPLYVNHTSNVQIFGAAIAPFAVDWIMIACVALFVYVILIGLALWRAEKGAVSALATPVS